MSDDVSAGAGVMVGIGYFRGNMGQGHSYQIGLRGDLGYIACVEEGCDDASSFAQAGVEVRARFQLKGRVGLIVGLTPGIYSLYTEYQDNGVTVDETDTGANVLVALGASFALTPNWEFGGTITGNFPVGVGGIGVLVSRNLAFGN